MAKERSKTPLMSYVNPLSREPTVVFIHALVMTPAHLGPLLPQLSDCTGVSLCNPLLKVLKVHIDSVLNV